MSSTRLDRESVSSERRPCTATTTVLRVTGQHLDVKKMGTPGGELEETPLHLNQRKRPKRMPLPSWSKDLTTILFSLKKLLAVGSDPLWLARTLTYKIACPVAHHVGIKKVHIPRRQDMIPKGILNIEDTKGKLNGEWVDFYSNPVPNTPAERVVLFFHGGAFFSCSRKSHRMLTSKFSKYGNCRVLSVDYRLSPEATYPLPLHDAISAYLYLIDPPADSQLPRYKPEQITLAGDSSGGNLSMALTLWLRDCQDKYRMPGAMTLMSPWLDLNLCFPSWKINHAYDYLPNMPRDKKYINENRKHFYIRDNSFLTDPYACPIFNKENPEKPLPPTLIHIGDAEKLRDENIIFVDKIFKNSNIHLEIYEDMPHIFPLFATFEKISRVSLRRYGAFIMEMDRQYKTFGKAVVQHQVTRVLNRPGFDIYPVHHPMSIVTEARDILRERGKWTHMDDENMSVHF